MNFIAKSLDQCFVSKFESPKRTAYVYFSSADGTGLGAGLCEMPAGSSNENHIHDSADEVIHIVKGTFKFVFPNEEVILKEFDCIYIPRGVAHHIFNIGKETAFHTFTFTDTTATDLIIQHYKK